ncbi:class I SAM-dependent methyltransferase [Streptomyces halobius]|uniref:Class I SAM-dependent methyltransferase n=1 Tax=Streptomyces halobius TaxID=2879846 RepID=A0ABY4MBL9_9ACTN|nr:class I SAM-dependent methyltransferase [Streptomyces halobius]UQA95142.1 class I SAM-dependent methyltransferase [Streptomyces halobius]
MPQSVKSAALAPHASSARLPDPARLPDREQADIAWQPLPAPPKPSYRRHLRHFGPRRGPARLLEIGCGTGGSLAGCAPGSVGVDHDPRSVALCRERGLTAYTADDFLASPHARPGTFDALLTAHVLQHLGDEQVESLLRAYLRYVRPGGGVVLITPQEAGHRADQAPDALLTPTAPGQALDALGTHTSDVRGQGPDALGAHTSDMHEQAPVRFTDFTLLRAFAETAGLAVRRIYSHPLPRPAGKLLRRNVFVLVGQVPR